MYMVTNLLRLIDVCLLFSLACGFVDYTENTELIQQLAGYDVRLQCNLKGLVDESLQTEIKIHWYFKQCHDNCYQLDNSDDWTALPCEQSFCQPELLLRNVTERYSGLYKCTINPHDHHHNNDIQLVRAYQLDVKNSSLATPEFLDAYPANKTAPQDSQVVFQCRVHSEEHPTIKWFRRHSYATSTAFEPPITASATSNFNANILRYNGRLYELLPTAPEKLIASQVYLSKLILNGVQLRDEGFYACVAISYRGYKIREAYLEVLPVTNEPEYWSYYDDSDEGGSNSQPHEFWMLFLMPLGLALLPLSVWCGYLLYKRFCKEQGQLAEKELDPERCVLGGY